MSRVLRIAVILVAVAALFEWWSGHRQAPVEQGGVDVTATTPADGRSSASLPGNLPPEAVATLRAIQQGGPFPYPRDGIVFQNRERRLPDRPQGYYHEYTVATPGSSDRGARRIVAGGSPPDVFYYTDDHYRTFRRVELSP